MHPSITIVLKGYPRLSETFIAQEIYALERRGLNLSIASLRLPTDPAVHPVHGAIQAPVLYLPEYLYQEPQRVARAWWKVRRFPGYKAARKAWLQDFAKDRSFNRVRRFGQAIVLAAELPPTIRFLYAHFLHTPGSVARYTSLITGIPWACSAHAKDIWTTPDWEIKGKLAECQWLVTCTASNAEHLKGLSPEPDKISLVYHGLDFDRFDEPPVRTDAMNRGSLCILSVGRAVEKKGFDDVLQALAGLPREPVWHFVHIGGGAMSEQLARKARSLGIAEKIEWRGLLPHEQVLSAYREADVFILACRVAEDGDRDGLPNVLLEAQSQKLPCVSTRISGVPELVEDGVTGLLVEQRDPPALTKALHRLMADRELRRKLGQAGYERVRSGFSVDAGIDQIIRQFPPDCVKGAAP